MQVRYDFILLVKPYFCKKKKMNTNFFVIWPFVPISVSQVSPNQMKHPPTMLQAYNPPPPQLLVEPGQIAWFLEWESTALAIHGLL